MRGVLDAADRPEMPLDPLAHHGLGGRPHVELGIERARDPFGNDHGLLQESNSGRVRMSKIAVTSNRSVSNFAIEISSAGRSWIGSPMARIGLREVLDRMV